MTYLYISTDLHTGTSGDIVASKELETMKELGKENNEDVIVLDFKDIHPLSYRLADSPFLIDYLTLYRLRELDLYKGEISLCHMYGGCFPLTIKYLKDKGVKITYSRMAHDRKISIEEHEKIYGPNSYPFAHVKDDRLWTIYIGGMTEVDIAIAPGQEPKRNLISEGVKEENIRIIPHGCNIPDENKIKYTNLNLSPFNIGYLGACGPDKGLLYLIQAWSALNYNDSTLILAGRGSEQLEPFIRKYSTGGRYNLIGYIQDVADFYNNISVYVQPSASEAFGIETIEAMSYGRPVIVSNGAGSSDCVRDGTDGFIVPKRDWVAIADKIAAMRNNRNNRNNPIQLREMGKNARNRSLEYSWDNIKQRYIRTWKELLNT